MSAPTNIRDPDIPLTLGAFRALQDEVRRLDAALRDARARLSAMQAPFDLAVKNPDYVPHRITTIIRVSEAHTDAAIREKLIAMGWTPPGKACHA